MLTCNLFDGRVEVGAVVQFLLPNLVVWVRLGAYHVRERDWGLRTVVFVEVLITSL